MSNQNDFLFTRTIELVSGIRKQTFMGMSSSQARLLTLTARMHDIEYKAQRLEAQKLQMANESRRAYEDYLNELDRTKLEAKVLGQDGSMTAIPFTADTVYTYKQLTNQYALKTSDDKMVISEEYHNAYSQTETLNDFLKMFNAVTSTSNVEVNTIPNPEYPIEQERYAAALESWTQRKEASEAKHAAWENKTGDYDKSRYQISIADAHLFDSDGVFGNACNNIMGGGAGIQVLTGILAFIIGYKNDNGFYTENGGDCLKPKIYQGNYYHGRYTTSTGATATIGYSGVHAMDDVGGGYVGNSIVNNLLNNYDGKTGAELLHLICMSVNDLSNGFTAADDTNADFAANYNSKTEYEKLISKYDENGNAKSFIQWAIDLYYYVDNTEWNTNRGKFIDGVNSTSEVNITGRPGSREDRVTSFQNILNDFSARLNQLSYFDEKSYKLAEPEPFNEPAPVRRDVPEFIEERTTNVLVNITDRNYAQWLINIWYRMEGSDESAEIRTEQITDEETGITTTIYTIDDKVKSNTTYETNKYDCLENENYIVIPQDKLNDPEWLKNCILEGWVLIQQFDTKGVKFNDTSVAVDTHLQEVADERSLKKAEAKYEADMRRIDQKDRRYDTQLAALDTERNAIKLEMETVKTVARDNVDRTFKLFS